MNQPLTYMDGETRMNTVLPPIRFVISQLLPQGLHVLAVENRFPSIHRENVKGTSQQNRDYVRKDGEKYNRSPDGSYYYTDGSGKTHIGTNHTDTFEEWGEMPIERQGKSKDVEKIYTLIKDGSTNLEIIDAVPAA